MIKKEIISINNNEGLNNKNKRGKNMKKLDQVMLALLVFAGINWGLWGLFEFNLVYYVFGKDWIDSKIMMV